MRPFIRIVESEGDLIAAAKAHFGITHDPRECGYILPDGTMLDLSGRHLDSSYRRDPDTNTNQPKRGMDHFRGSRLIDHRDLDELVSESGTEGMHEFMQRSGAIRFMPEVGFGLIKMPTARQLATGVACHFGIAKSRPLHVDVIGANGNEQSREFSDADLAAILGFIRRALAGRLDEYGRRDLTKLPSFKRWFKNSKVVDDRGNPQVVYHATMHDGFETFRTVENPDFGAHFGTLSQANWFVPSDENGVRRNPIRGRQIGIRRGHIIPVYLSIQKPLRLTDRPEWSSQTIIPELRDRGIEIDLPVFGMPQKSQGSSPSLSEVMMRRMVIAAIERAGYDGIVYENEFEGSGDDSWIAFHPWQIKSAIGAKTFDPSSPVMTESMPRIRDDALFGYRRSDFWYQPSSGKIIDASYYNHAELVALKPTEFGIPVAEIVALKKKPDFETDWNESTIRLANAHGWVRCKIEGKIDSPELALQSSNRRDLHLAARKCAEWFHFVTIYLDSEIKDYDTIWHEKLTGEQIDYYLKTGRIRRKLVNEAYHETQKTGTFNDDDLDIDVDIFKNPTAAEIGKMMREHGFVRGFFDANDLYVWRGDVLHHQVEAPGEHWITIEPTSAHIDWNNEIENEEPYGPILDMRDAKAFAVEVHPILKRLLRGKTVTARPR